MKTYMEPFLISGIRRHPTGEVVHLPEGGVGKLGTFAASFLREYDEAVEALTAERDAALLRVEELERHLAHSNLIINKTYGLVE